MSGFVVRDYLTPAVAIQATKIATKNLYKQVAGTTTIGGIPVINSRIYFYGTYFTAIRDGIRDDKVFNKFITRLGMKHKDLVNSDYRKVKNVYFYINTSKLTYESQTDNFIAGRFNDEYATTNISREYIDVKITVGGDYRNKIYANNAELTLQAADLPALRSEIEKNIIKYVRGGEYATSNVPMRYTKTGTIYAPTVGISYNTNTGSMYDVCALLDDGSVYECTHQCINEIFSVKEVQNGPSINGINRISGNKVSTHINLEYSYIKRYKLKRNAVATDKMIVELKAMSDLHTNDMSNTSKYSIVARTRSLNNDLFTKIIIALNDTGAEGSDFINGCLKLSSYEAMTPTEMIEFLGKCLDTDYTEKSHDWWEAALAIVIVIIAIVIVVVVFILTGGVGAVVLTGFVSSLAAGFASGAIFLAIAGAIYAKNVGDPGGMRLIGNTMTFMSVAAAICAIPVLVSNPVGASMWEVYRNYAMAVLLTVSIVDQVSIITLSEENRMYVQIATAIIALEIGLEQVWKGGGSFASAGDGLVNTACKNVAGYSNLTANGMKSYMLIDQVSKHEDKESLPTEDQAVPEDGVENVYVMQEKSWGFDALEALERSKEKAYGGMATELAISNSTVQYVDIYKHI